MKKTRIQKVHFFVVRKETIKNKMFGYLEPVKDELKYKYIKEYKKNYCSICNGLKKEFGVIYTALLNYEMVYLYLFIEGIASDRQNEEHLVKCPLNPFYKVRLNVNTRLLDYVCFINYYLAVKKIEDNYIDENSILYKVIYFFAIRKKRYKKKMEKYSIIIKLLEEKMEKFFELERDKEADFDELAVIMGQSLEAIVGFYLEQDHVGKIEERNIAREISFHLGELIYLLDALEDYDEDLKKKRFNPLCKMTLNNQDEKRKEDLKKGVLIANLMINKIKSLKHKIKFYCHEDILNNILEDSLEDSLKKIVRKNFNDYREGKMK